MKNITGPTKRGDNVAMADLRKQLQGLEGRSTFEAEGVPLEIPEIDQSMSQGGLSRAAIHEFMSITQEDAAATEGFVLALLSKLAAKGGAVVWINKTQTLFPPGLRAFGVDPDKFLFFHVSKDREALWAMEEALRCTALCAVVGEIPDADLTATRRLQLAVEDSRVTGFLLRHKPKKTGSSACHTRWQVQSMPSFLDDNMPGVGFPRWRVELLKARNGKPGLWNVEWKPDGFALIERQTQHTNPGLEALTG